MRGWYFLCIVGVAVAPLSVEAGLPAAEDDAGSGSDASGSPDEAVPVEPGVSYSGFVGSVNPFEGDVDLYRIRAVVGAMLHVRFWSPGGCLSVWDSVKHVAFACSSTTGSGRSISIVVDREGPWYLRVEGIAYPYRFAYALDGEAPIVQPARIAGVHDDAATGQDAPDAMLASIPIESSRVYSGNLSVPQGDSDDWFAFSGSSGERIDFCLWAAQLPWAMLELVRPDGTRRAWMNAVVEDDIATPIILDATGSWSLHASLAATDEGSVASYRFSFNRGGAAPSTDPLGTPGC